MHYREVVSFQPPARFDKIRYCTHKNCLKNSILACFKLRQLLLYNEPRSESDLEHHKNDWHIKCTYEQHQDLSRPLATEQFYMLNI